MASRDLEKFVLNFVDQSFSSLPGFMKSCSKPWQSLLRLVLLGVWSFSQRFCENYSGKQLSKVSKFGGNLKSWFVIQ